jgi:hypothetical protein
LVKKNWLYIISLGFLGLLTACASGPKIGQLAADDVYTLNITGEHPAVVHAFIPVAAKTFDKRWLVVNEDVVYNQWASASFYSQYMYYNAITFQIAPHDAYKTARTFEDSPKDGYKAIKTFEDFQAAFKQAVMVDYARSNADLKLIHEEKTTFHGRPAVYNVYTITPVDGYNLEAFWYGEATPAIIMQYIVDYQYHFANIEFIASTYDFHRGDRIKAPQQAIHREYEDANQFFDSFNLRYGE